MASSPNYIRRPFSHPPESFPRDGNELVDIDAYEKYLVDHPDDVPIDMVGGLQKIWMYQHLYFQRPFYKQQNVSKHLRDRVLSDFSNAPYNQLAMRRAKELQVHREFEEHVLPPSPETMKKSMVDFRHLDILGAAAIGRRVALVPEALEYLVPGASPYRQTGDYSPVETADFFDSELERALQVLRTPLVTPQRVITGVIKRTGRILNSELLKNEAEVRINEDPVYYPVRLRKLGHFYKMSKELLENTCLVEAVENDEIHPTTLQTGVDGVELAA